MPSVELAASSALQPCHQCGRARPVALQVRGHLAAVALCGECRPAGGPAFPDLPKAGALLCAQCAAPAVRYASATFHDDAKGREMRFAACSAACDRRLSAALAEAARARGRGVECAACGKTGAAKRCGRCQLARYCGEACQRAAWAAHRGQCAAPARPGLGVAQVPARPD